MRALAQHAGTLLVCKACPHRQTAGNALCQCRHVCLVSELFTGKECTGSAHTGLHFVRNDQHVLCGTLLENSVHECLLQCIHAALALNVFQHHCTNGVVQLGFQIGNVIGCHIVEALHKREEIVVEYVLTGGGQSAEGSAVE